MPTTLQNTEIRPAETETHLITTDQLAARLQKTRRTIELWNERYNLPRIKIGRSVLYNWPAVVTHLEEKFGK